MIERVRFWNYKALRDVEVKLERFTIIVGPNGSGKSSILEGIHGLATNPANLPFNLFGTKGTPAKEFAVEIDIYRNRDRETIRLSDSSFYYPCLLLCLSAQRLASASYSNARTPEMERDGEGLASVLADLALSKPEQLQALQLSLKQVIPQIERIRLVRAQVERTEIEKHVIDGVTVTQNIVRTVWGHRVVLDLLGAPDLAATEASEGTLLVLGLLATLFTNRDAKTILLDDIDRGLHPKAMRDLIAQLRRLLELNPDLQIIATTHSPYLVDQFKPEEVRLTTIREDGSVVCAGLAEHPEFDKWKDVMTPGEFWSSVGEDWIKQLRQPKHD